ASAATLTRVDPAGAVRFAADTRFRRVSANAVAFDATVANQGSTVYCGKVVAGPSYDPALGAGPQSFSLFGGNNAYDGFGVVKGNVNTDGVIRFSFLYDHPSYAANAWESYNDGGRVVVSGAASSAAGFRDLAVRARTFAVQAQAAASVAATARAAASATADIVQAQASGGAVQFAVGPAGQLKTNQAV